MRTMMAIAVLGAAALGLSGCATGQSAAAPGTDPVETAVIAPPTSLPVPSLGEGAPGELSGEVAAGVIAVRDYAPTAYPTVYAGVGSGTPQSVDRLVIYLTGGSAQIEEDLRAVSGVGDPTKVVFREGWLSVAQSPALDARVRAEVPRLMSEGYQIQSYGVGVDGAEEIGVHELSDVQSGHLFDLFGPSLRLQEVVANSFGEFTTPAPG